MKERAFSYLCGLKGKSGVILAERESSGFMVNKKEIWHSVCNNYSPRRDKDKKMWTSRDISFIILPLS